MHEQNFMLGSRRACAQVRAKPPTPQYRVPQAFGQPPVCYEGRDAPTARLLVQGGVRSFKREERAAPARDLHADSGSACARQDDLTSGPSTMAFVRGPGGSRRLGTGEMSGGEQQRISHSPPMLSCAARA